MLFRCLLKITCAVLVSVFLPLAALAEGSCTLTCTSAGGVARTVGTPITVSDASACACTASSCNGAETCAANFVATGAVPSTATPQVCSCTCAPTAGTAPSVSVTAGTCTNAAGCTTVCAQRCAQATAPVTAGMHPDPAHPGTCGAAAPAASATGGGQATLDVSGAVGQAVQINLSQPIDGVRQVSDLGNYIAVVYRYLIGLAGTAAVIMIVYGGFRYLLGSAAGSVEEGKTIIQDALLGLLLVLGAYFILATVNPNTLSLKVPNIAPITRVALPANPSTFSGRPAASNIGNLCRCRGVACRGLTPDCPAQGGTCPDTLHSLACSNSQTCVYDLVQRTNSVQNAWRCMTIPTISNISNIVSNQDALRQVEGCTNDEECQDSDHLNNPAARCLMDTAPNGRGYCTLGELGQRCRCTVSTQLSNSATAACDEGIDSIFGGALARYTGSPTNNAGTGFVSCQAGLTCKLLTDTPVSAASSTLSSYQQRWYCQPSYAGTAPATPAATAPAR